MSILLKAENSIETTRFEAEISFDGIEQRSSTAESDKQRTSEERNSPTVAEQEYFFDLKGLSIIQEDPI